MFFFFSSRRRHTRLQGDWSSDVCSSDLGSELARLERAHQLDAAARAVGFVTGSEEGGARLETEAAMNTGIQPFEAAPIRHSVPSTATTKASPGSNVRDRKSTRLNSSHLVISYA